MEESPGEGSDVVEELEGVVGTFGIDGTGTEEELEVGVDLFRRPVCDSPVVCAVFPGSSGPVCEIRRDRAC